MLYKTIAQIDQKTQPVVPTPPTGSIDIGIIVGALSTVLAAIGIREIWPYLNARINANTEIEKQRMGIKTQEISSSSSFTEKLQTSYDKMVGDLISKNGLQLDQILDQAESLEKWAESTTSWQQSITELIESQHRQTIAIFAQFDTKMAIFAEKHALIREDLERIKQELTLLNASNQALHRRMDPSGSKES